MSLCTISQPNFSTLAIVRCSLESNPVRRSRCVLSVSNSLSVAIRCISELICFGRQFGIQFDQIENISLLVPDKCGEELL